MGSEDDTLQIPTRERMKAMATVKVAAERLEADGTPWTDLGTKQTATPDAARAAIESWPDAPKSTAEVLLDHYGAPNEVTPTRLAWFATGPWSRMEITADQVLHHFPTPHTDYFTQFVRYRVPIERVSDLVAFDGSVLVDRTTGELGARCDHEAFNVLTLNLAVEIIDGRRTVADARELYAETAAAYVMGRDAPYAERLHFHPSPEQDTTDPDEAILAPQMAEQMAEKMKDLFGAGEPPR
jgi:hypothetical protein